MKTTLETRESYLTRIAGMSRGELIEEIRTFHCRFPLDFTREYLDAQGTDRLRHILAGALLHVAQD